MSVSIATWNINSVKARLAHLLTWLRESACDVVLLQELKCEDAAFPAMEIEDLGYNIALCGQKTYNGVAVLSKYPLDDVIRGLPGEDGDEQARYIEATVCLPGSTLRVASIYVPNGQEVGSAKFAYKLRFYDRLTSHARALLAREEPVILGGDYNVAPYAPDVYAPEHLDGTICYHPDERAKLRALLHLGYYDAFRARHPQAQQFSWWDYRGGGYQHNKGLRIDHLLLNAYGTDRLEDCRIDETPRGWEKPSDHAPVLCSLRTA